MQRWMNEQPYQSPYHNIGSVAENKDAWVQTANSQSKQQTETSSNKATAGSLVDDNHTESPEKKPEVYSLTLRMALVSFGS